jgi:hypothetical protein
MPGDKHSGDPVETDVAPGAGTELDFVVADLSEALKLHARERVGPARLQGRIVDEKGVPVKGAYAIAHRRDKILRVPDFLSAWVGDDGRYTLFLPRGRYYIGSAVKFPPGDDYLVDRQMTVDADTADVDIVRKPVHPIHGQPTHSQPISKEN